MRSQTVRLLVSVQIKNCAIENAESPEQQGASNVDLADRDAKTMTASDQNSDQEHNLLVGHHGGCSQNLGTEGGRHQ